MRRLACFIAWAATAAGCGLAPSSPVPDPLYTVQGRIEGLNVARVAETASELAPGVDARLWVVLSWFRRANATQGVPPWIAAEAVETRPDSAFQLRILRPPPAEALFALPTVVDDEPAPSGQIAFGVLSGVVASDGFGWARTVTTPPEAAVVAHEYEALIIYWAGTGTVEVLGDDLETLTVPRGLSRVEPVVSSAFDRLYAPRSSQDAVLEPGDRPPEWAFCDPGAEVGSNTIPAAEVDQYPPAGTVDCWSCDGLEAYETRCPEAFGLLCRTCAKDRVVALEPDDLERGEWPCLPEGNDCAIEGDVVCRSDGIQYRCENGVWATTGCVDCCFNECAEDG